VVVGTGGIGNPFGRDGSGNGGGLFNASGGTVTARSSLIAGNRTGVNGPDLSGAFISGGFNLIGERDASSGFSDGVNQDQVGSVARRLNPQLGALADNGGPTFTHALLTGSPAIDKGNSFGLASDQRGALRPFNFPLIAHATDGDDSDIGAVELQPNSRLLGITRSANNVVLSWPASRTGYTLQSNPDPNIPVIWRNVPDSPAIVGSQFVVTNSAALGKRFYRLK